MVCPKIAPILPNIGGFIIFIDKETVRMSNVAEGHHTVGGRATTTRVGGIVAESLTLASATRLSDWCWCLMIRNLVFEFSVLQCIDVYSKCIYTGCVDVQTNTAANNGGIACSAQWRPQKTGLSLTVPNSHG